MDINNLPNTCTIASPLYTVGAANLSVPEHDYTNVAVNIPFWPEPLSTKDAAEFIGFYVEAPHRLWFHTDYKDYLGVGYHFTDNDDLVYLQVADAIIYEEGIDDHIEVPAKMISISAAIPKPVILSFALNGGDEQVYGASVFLGNECSGSPTHYMASESPFFVGAAWIDYSTNPNFTLSSGTGVKTVYFKVKNATYESSVVSDSIYKWAVFTPPVQQVPDPTTVIVPQTKPTDKQLWLHAVLEAKTGNPIDAFRSLTINKWTRDWAPQLIDVVSVNIPWGVIEPYERNQFVWEDDSIGFNLNDALSFIVGTWGKKWNLQLLPMCNFKWFYRPVPVPNATNGGHPVGWPFDSATKIAEYQDDRVWAPNDPRTSNFEYDYFDPNFLVFIKEAYTALKNWIVANGYWDSLESVTVPVMYQSEFTAHGYSSWWNANNALGQKRWNVTKIATYQNGIIDYIQSLFPGKTIHVAYQLMVVGTTIPYADITNIFLNTWLPQGIAIGNHGLNPKNKIMNLPPYGSGFKDNYWYNSDGSPKDNGIAWALDAADGYGRRIITEMRGNETNTERWTDQFWWDTFEHAEVFRANCVSLYKKHLVPKIVNGVLEYSSQSIVEAWLAAPIGTYHH